MTQSDLGETLVAGSMHARGLACGSNWRANLEGRSTANQLVIALMRVQVEREEVECLTMELDAAQRRDELLTRLYLEKDLSVLEKAALTAVERFHSSGVLQDRDLVREANTRLRRMPVTFQQRYTFPGWREYGAEPDLSLPLAPAEAQAQSQESTGEAVLDAEMP